MTALAARARALLDAATSRGRIKQLATELDGDPALRRAVVDAGNARGADLPDDAIDWPSARLLRRARGREAAARVRTNPVRRDEGFVCVHCGAEVPPLGVTDRDHCPRCLRSLHVDVVPGDRASGCGGVFDPVGAELVAGRTAIRYRCRSCGARHRVRVADDDDWEQVVAASALGGGA
ncbi:MAG: RNHCP domain-containing protein [Myxococcota bacterium]